MGHSTSSGRDAQSTATLAGQRTALMSAARDYMNYNLDPGMESARVLNVTDLRTGKVRIDYSAEMRVPVGRDPETGREEYEYETEYGFRHVDIEDLRRRIR